MNEIKKTRIRSYCPDLNENDYKLLCEWDKCDYVSNNMDDYMTHIDKHLDEHLNNKNAKEERNRQSLSKFYKINYRLKVLIVIAFLDLDCKWRECDMDNSKFDSISTYERHVRYHAFHTKLKYIGKIVLDNFNETASKSKDKLNKNLVAINLNFIQECSLDKQSRNLIPELPYKFECSWHRCEYNTDNPELFYRHIKEHINEVKENAKCAANKSKTRKKTGIDKPSKVTNENSKMNCLWNDCKQVISNANRLAEHMRHHSQEKLVACYVCGSLFASFTKYIDHCSRSNATTSAGATTAKPIKFQCSHCSKKFLTNNLLKEHLRKHINKYKCSQCDMTCTTKNDLDKHVTYKHSDEKPFKCEYCEYKCKAQNDLNKHVQAKHMDTYEYQCNDCNDYVTKSLSLMKKHMMKYHLNQSKMAYLYKCHICEEKIYTNGSTLSTHLKQIHNVQWPSGHSRFRYKLDSDGFYRLQTLRYESIELVEQIKREQEEKKKLEHQQRMIEHQKLQQQLFEAVNYEMMVQQDDRVNDFDDEEIMDEDEENEEEEEVDEEVVDDDDDDESEDKCDEEDEEDMEYSSEFDIQIHQNEHEPQQSRVLQEHEAFNSFANNNNFKAYLIKRLIDDENKVKCKKRTTNSTCDSFVDSSTSNI